MNNNMNGTMTQNTAAMNGKQACAKWDDQCMLGDLLDTSKHIATEYGTLVIEGSNAQLRQMLTNNMNETINDQFQIFEQMQQRGWYKTKPAQQPDIATAKQKFTQTKNQLM